MTRHIRTCEVEDCEGKTGVRGTARGLCSKHYSRLRRNGSPSVKTRHVFVTHLQCVVGGCDRLQVGRGYCAKHWQQWKRRGDPEAPPIRPPKWAPAELRHLDDVLDATPGGYGDAAYNSLQDVARVLVNRTDAAIRTKLSKMRRQRIADYHRKAAQMRLSGGPDAGV